MELKNADLGEIECEISNGKIILLEIEKKFLDIGQNNESTDREYDSLLSQTYESVNATKIQVESLSLDSDDESDPDD